LFDYPPPNYLSWVIYHLNNGGAGRDRTDDLKLAKLPLSQLSYGPIRANNPVTENKIMKGYVDGDKTI
jgi:hypothetical protein